MALFSPKQWCNLLEVRIDMVKWFGPCSTAKASRMSIAEQIVPFWSVFVGSHSGFLWRPTLQRAPRPQTLLVGSNCTLTSYPPTACTIGSPSELNESNQLRFILLVLPPFTFLVTYNPMCSSPVLFWLGLPDIARMKESSQGPAVPWHAGRKLPKSVWSTSYGNCQCCDLASASMKLFTAIISAPPYLFWFSLPRGKATKHWGAVRLAHYSISEWATETNEE